VVIHVRPRQLQYWSTTSGWTTATSSRTVSVSASATQDLLHEAITIS
jgi:hypothetical protein